MIKLQTDHGFHKFNTTNTVVCSEKDGTLYNGYTQLFFNILRYHLKHTLNYNINYLFILKVAVETC